jgi:hypothetical protein
MLTALAGSIVLAGLLLVAEGTRRPGPDRAVADVQTSLGGLGLGAAVVPAWSFSAFDPRLEPVCESCDAPMAGGPCYSPDHLGPVSQFRVPPGLDGVPEVRRDGAP